MVGFLPLTTFKVWTCLPPTPRYLNNRVSTSWTIARRQLKSLIFLKYSTSICDITPVASNRKYTLYNYIKHEYGTYKNFNLYILAPFHVHALYFFKKINADGVLCSFCNSANEILTGWVLDPIFLLQFFLSWILKSSMIRSKLLVIRSFVMVTLIADKNFK